MRLNEDVLRNILENIGPFLRQNRILEIQHRFLDIVSQSIARTFGTGNIAQVIAVSVLPTLHFGKLRASPTLSFRPELNGLLGQLDGTRYIGQFVELRKNLTERGVLSERSILGSPVSSLAALESPPISRGQLGDSGKESTIVTDSKLEHRGGKHTIPGSPPPPRSRAGELVERIPQKRDSRTKSKPISEPAHETVSRREAAPMHEILKMPGRLQRVISGTLLGKFGNIRMSSAAGTSKGRGIAGTPKGVMIKFPLQSFTNSPRDFGGIVKSNSTGNTESENNQRIRMTDVDAPMQKLKKGTADSKDSVLSLLLASSAAASEATHRHLAGYESLSEGPRPKQYPPVSKSRVSANRTAMDELQIGENIKKTSETFIVPLHPSKIRVEQNTTNMAFASKNIPATSLQNILPPNLLSSISSLAQAWHPLALRTMDWISRSYEASNARLATVPVDKIKSGPPIDARTKADPGHHASAPSELEITQARPKQSEKRSPIVRIGTPLSTLQAELGKYPIPDPLKKPYSKSSRGYRQKSSDSFSERENKSGEVIALRETYSKFMLDRLFRARKEGVAAAILLQTESKDLTVMPPRSERVRRTYGGQLGRFRATEGSLDLPNVAQLRLILEENSKRASSPVGAGLSVASIPLFKPVTAPAFVPGPGSIRTKIVQTQKSTVVGLSSESIPVSQKDTQPALKVGHSRETGWGREGRTLSDRQPEKGQSILSLRTLRKMMEQIFQEELKRYGL